MRNLDDVLKRRDPERPVVMGVVNVTHDSFSDGGRYRDPQVAVAHGRQLYADGADLVDVGGESTRPGAARVDPDEELQRVVPVVRELAAGGVPVSVDTTRAAVAAAALEAGAVVVNDVSGGLADPALRRLVAEAGCPWIVMHSRGDSRTMASRAVYQDVVAEVRTELTARIDEAVAAGVDPGQLILDPGIGFAKTADHNWRLLAALGEVVSLGCPVLVGASRKSFLGALLAGPGRGERPVGQRDAATVAVTVLAVAAGAWGVRVHDVRPNVDAIRVWRATEVARWCAPEAGPIRT